MGHPHQKALDILLALYSGVKDGSIEVSACSLNSADGSRTVLNLVTYPGARREVNPEKVKAKEQTAEFFDRDQARRERWFDDQQLWWRAGDYRKPRKPRKPRVKKPEPKAAKKPLTTAPTRVLDID